jgi:hypothetical protein
VVQALNLSRLLSLPLCHCPGVGRLPHSSYSLGQNISLLSQEVVYGPSDHESDFGSNSLDVLGGQSIGPENSSWLFLDMLDSQDEATSPLT